MSGIVWIARMTVELLHAESLADHGGLPGLRDEGLLESALARPIILHAYEGVDDIPSLSACYAVALAKNHPFNDGNKRIAFVTALVFAEMNGLRILADQAEAAQVMLEVAAGNMDQPAFALWLRHQAKPRG